MQNISHAGNCTCINVLDCSPTFDILWCFLYGSFQDVPLVNAAQLAASVKIKPQHLGYLIKKGKAGDILYFSYCQQIP